MQIVCELYMADHLFLFDYLERIYDAIIAVS